MNTFSSEGGVANALHIFIVIYFIVTPYLQSHIHFMHILWNFRSIMHLLFGGDFGVFFSSGVYSNNFEIANKND